MRDLKEYSLVELEAEMKQRKTAAREGKCDYCGKPLFSEPACRQRSRHGVRIGYVNTSNWNLDSSATESGRVDFGDGFGS